MSASTTIALYPGSFDPLTNGHLDIIERASHIFDHLIVGIGASQAKSTLFSLEERLGLLSSATKHLKHMEVAIIPGLLVDFAEQKGAQVILRGLRSETDFSYEFPMAMMNRRIGHNIETLFMATSDEYAYISSTLVKEVARLGKSVEAFVPQQVAQALQEKFK